MRYRALVVSLSLCAVLGTVLPNGAAQDAGSVPAATWRGQPKDSAFVDNYPPLARARALDGGVVLHCVVEPDGGTNCSVVEEEPAGAGFGAAAIEVMRSAELSPAQEGGVPVRSELRVPLRFSAQSSPAPISPALAITGIRGAGRVDDDGRHGGRYYPRAAHLVELEGRAVVACAFRSNRSANCVVDSEEPEGWGFGDRALYVMSRMQSPQDARPGEATLTPFNFRLREPTSEERAAAASINWLRTPSRREREAAYPGEARRSRVDGRVALDCQILSDGKLNCFVAGEHPLDHQFGAAALSLVNMYQLAPDQLQRDGFAPGDSILLPISFLAR